MRIIGVDHEGPAGIEMPEKLGLGVDDASEVGKELGVDRSDPGVEQNLRV